MMQSPANQTAGLRNIKLPNRGDDLERTALRPLPVVDDTKSNTNNRAAASSGSCWAESNAFIFIAVFAMTDRLQHVQVSPRVLRWMRRWKRSSDKPSSSTAASSSVSVQADSDDDKEANVVYWISGLDQVVMGKQSVADSVIIMGQYKILPYLCYMLSGMVCDVLMLLTDVLWHFGFGIQDATTCWTISFILSIVPRHSALKVMCFGQYVGGYYHSLARMYLGMSASIALSTIGNYVMTKHWGVAHYVAWIVTLIWTGVVNYFVLKKCWSFGDDKLAESE